MMKLIPFVALFLVVQHTAAFSNIIPTQRAVIESRRSQSLFLSPEDDNEPPKLAAEFVPGAASNNVDPEEENNYPIALPSPILLGGSMILGIASIGSIFELTGGTPPPLGLVPTLGIVAVGLPTCLFLFYASILKAQAETIEDDKKFLGR